MLSGTIGMAGLVYIWAATRGVRPLVYLLKPGTMALILWLAARGLAESPRPAYAWLVVIGLAVAAVGDVLLMLPRERLAGGLAAFLLAHLCYLAALWTAGALHLSGAAGVAGALLVSFAIFMFRRVGDGMRKQGRTRLLLPVAAYVAVITLMVWAAVAALFQPAPLPLRRWLVAAGALLFYVSDGALAWDKFIRPLPARHAIIMATYFGAQFCFAASVAWPPDS